jgi:hypothetical protein
MSTGEIAFLLLVLTVFAAFIGAAVVGIVKYHTWRTRRGTSDSGFATGVDGSTPPSYPAAKNP